MCSYVKPEFSAEKIREIRLGLVSGVGIRKYLDPSLNFIKMISIRYKLEKELTT